MPGGFQPAHVEQPRADEAIRRGAVDEARIDLAQAVFLARIKVDRVAIEPAPAEKAETSAPAAGGSSAVQIGAFSSTAIADREYAAVAARFPQFASGAGKRVQEVTASNGSTVYRTTFSGLSRERATAFCNALKAAGRDCIVR